jgi:hypothetical protein
VWITLLNPDGTVKDEHAIGAGVGGFAGTLEIGDAFGRRSLLGDLDGNGAADLAVGAPVTTTARRTPARCGSCSSTRPETSWEQKISALTPAIGTLGEDIYPATRSRRSETWTATASQTSSRGPRGRGKMSPDGARSASSS